MYYSDRTLFKERLDLVNQNYYTIIDFEHYREYILYKGYTFFSLFKSFNNTK